MKRKLRLLFCMVMMMTMAFGLQVSAAGNITINNCLITGNQVAVTAYGANVASDDGNYYLFALQPYEVAIGARTDFCDVRPKAEGVIYMTPLNLNTAASKLYCRFQVAVLRGGQFVPVSNEYYITNPEARAQYTYAYPKAASIKGLLVDPNKLRGNELSDLGVKQAAYNIPVGRLVGHTSSANYPPFIIVIMVRPICLTVR